MSATLALGTLTSATTATAVATGTTPFIQKNSAALLMHSTTGAFSGSAKVQSSDDNSIWSDVSGSTITGPGLIVVNIASLARYYRLNCTSFTSGSVSATLIPGA